MMALARYNGVQYNQVQYDEFTPALLPAPPQVARGGDELGGERGVRARRGVGGVDGVGGVRPAKEVRR